MRSIMERSRGVDDRVSEWHERFLDRWNVER